MFFIIGVAIIELITIKTSVLAQAVIETTVIGMSVIEIITIFFDNYLLLFINYLTTIS